MADQVKDSAASRCGITKISIAGDFSGVFNDHPAYHLIKQRPVNRHEIALNIHLQDIAIIVIILRTGSDKMVYPLYSVMCSLSFTATVAVVDKPLFKNRGNVVEDKVMNNAIAEIGSKHFAFHRFINYETNARAWFVPEVYDFIAKFDQIVFVAKFKFQDIICIPLVASSRIICIEQVN